MLMVILRLPIYSPIHSRMVNVAYTVLLVLLLRPFFRKFWHRIIIILLCAGVFIDYYGGEAESHIVQYAARLYFVCKAGTDLEGPVLEHLKDSYVAHIHFYTKHVC